MSLYSRRVSLWGRVWVQTALRFYLFPWVGTLPLLQQGYTNFPKIWQPRQISGRQEVDKKPVTRWGTTDIGHHSVAMVAWPLCFVHPYSTLRLAVKWTEFNRYACLMIETRVLWLYVVNKLHRDTTLNHRVQSWTDAFRHLLLRRHRCLESRYSDTLYPSLIYIYIYKTRIRVSL